MLTRLTYSPAEGHHDPSLASLKSMSQPAEASVSTQSARTGTNSATRMVKSNLLHDRMQTSYCWHNDAFIRVLVGRES